MTIQMSRIIRSSNTKKRASFRSCRLGLGTVALTATLSLSSSKAAVALSYNPTGVFFANTGVPTSDLALTSTGEILVTSYDGGWIRRYNSSGGLLSQFGTNLNGPWGIAADSTGTIFAANFNANELQRYNSSGVLLGSTPFNEPGGIAIESSGNVLVSSYSAPSIGRFSSTGTFLGTFTTSNLSNPLGIAINSATGEVLVANRGSDSITRYDSAGVFQSTLVSGLPGVIDVVIDSTGDVLVSTATSVQRFNGAGVLQQTLIPLGTGEIEGLTLDGTGSLLAGQRDGTITRFTAIPVPFAFCPLWGFLPLGIRRLKQQFSKLRNRSSAQESSF